MSLSISQTLTQTPADLAGILDTSSGVDGVVAQLDPTRLAPEVTKELGELTASRRMEAIKHYVLQNPRELESLAAAVDESPVFLTTQFDNLARPMTADDFIRYGIFEGAVSDIERELSVSMVTPPSAQDAEVEPSALEVAA